MVFYAIEPEVAGGFGEHTEIDRTSGKMVVTKLHYELEGWLGDALLESVPCFIGTKALADAIGEKNLTGVALDDVEVTTSTEFQELYPNRAIPKFVWLKITGRPAHDDFGIAPGLMLVVSERALRTLKNIGISNAASIVEFFG